MTTSTKPRSNADDCVDAMVAIAKQFEADGQGRGTIVCPKCQGTMDYGCGKRGRQLMIRGRCRTDNCMVFLT